MSGVVRHSSQAQRTWMTLTLSHAISVGVLAGLMQSLCKQVINGSEHCSYGWRAGEGGASLEES